MVFRMYVPIKGTTGFYLFETSTQDSLDLKINVPTIKGHNFLYAAIE
jgi:hypothetical protein